RICRGRSLILLAKSPPFQRPTHPSLNPPKTVCHKTALKSCLVSKTSTPFRSEEHTSELQSRGHLVCRLLLEKKLIVRAPVGDLQVDTNGREAVVDFQVDNSLLQVQENCGKDVELTGNAPDPAQVHGTIVWRI